MRTFSWIVAAIASIYSVVALIYTTNLLLSRVWPFKTLYRAFSSQLSFPLDASRVAAPSFMTSTDPTFLSKAFSDSMKPSRIIPYYYKATGAFVDEDITITTLVTSSRFQVFSRLVSTYQG